MPKHTFQDMVRVKRKTAESAGGAKKILRIEEKPLSSPHITVIRRKIEDNPILRRPVERPIQKIVVPKVEERVGSKESIEESRPEAVFVERNLNKGKPSRSQTTYTGGEFGENYSPKDGRHGMWFVAIISIIFLLFAVTLLFAQAKVTINPNIEEFVLAADMTASRDATPDTLSFDLVLISGEESNTLTGGTQENVTRPARGTVILYNTFSSAPQTLDVDTRLEGSNGKIYKTDKRITVPGMKDSVPGSLEVGIYGSEVGDAYNSPPLDFKILGFKGGPKYEKFYGRSKGPIEGGFVGAMTVVSEGDKAAALEALKESLKAKLLKKTIDQIPDGFILFRDAVRLVIDEEVVDATSSAGSVPIKIKGTLYGFLFEEDELTSEIVGSVVKGYDGSPVYIPKLSDFIFTLAEEDITFKDTRNISFHLSGSSRVVWKIDENKIISDTLGIKKKDFQNVLSTYKNIDTASVVLRPFWKTSFPEKMKKIKVEVKYPD